MWSAESVFYVSSKLTEISNRVSFYLINLNLDRFLNNSVNFIGANMVNYILEFPKLAALIGIKVGFT